MDTEINWGRIGRAVEFYKALGYTYVELPWTASENYMQATIGRVHMLNSDLGFLVGSAEQAFIERDGKRNLPKGKYVACTPCFRDDVKDDTHNKTFMKVEIYQNDVVSPSEMTRTLANVRKFLVQEGAKPEIVVRETIDEVELEVNGIEVGSYGMREYGNIKWIYATGLAEPRLSKALEIE